MQQMYCVLCLLWFGCVCGVECVLQCGCVEIFVDQYEVVCVGFVVLLVVVEIVVEVVVDVLDYELYWCVGQCGEVFCVVNCVCFDDMLQCGDGCFVCVGVV